MASTDASPREDLISTAVKFLSNPNILSSPIDRKRDFLRSKGLTDEEIRRAFERRSVSEPLAKSGSSIALNALAAVGVAYALYWVYKRWLEALLFGETRRRRTTDEQLAELRSSLEALVLEIKREIVTVRSEVDRLNNSHSNAVTRAQIESLKSEITSVKGILLSRNQFPQLRTEPPSIPAWQLEGHRARTLPDASPPPSDHEKEAKEHDEDIICGRGERSESGGSHSSEGEVVTKNSDSSLEIIQ